MSRLCFCIFGIFFLGTAKAASISEPTKDLNGYVVESHDVTTSDGYILGLRRIPYARNVTSETADPKRPVVFLMHGFGGQWMNYLGPLAPELSMGYNLVDAGFDVWIGNARGNIFSRRHISLNPDDPVQKFKFWDFSWAEIGLYDLPAMIDYALQHTGNKQLYYIGGSQGGTTFLVMSSRKPEYNAKIAYAHLLAGVGYQKHFPNKQLTSIASASDIFMGITNALGQVELTEEFLKLLTPGNGTGILFGGPSDDPNNTQVVNNKEGAELYGGTSFKALYHYCQNVRDKLFRSFQYDALTNVAKYGSINAPLYDLSKITSSVTMHYGPADEVLSELDVLAMVKDMPNTVPRKVASPTFGHSDYLLSKDAKHLVTDFIIQSIKDVHAKKLLV
ncbi:hypothetical protein O0L34_g11894 [Tuta absoluta]|nr:hypothetical protein O0L34_g11894 [Tuta absoluta]